MREGVGVGDDERVAAKVIVGVGVLVAGTVRVAVGEAVKIPVGLGDRVGVAVSANNVDV